MMKQHRTYIAKLLSVGIMFMGGVHMAATFTPMIADKLTLLPKSVQDAFTYFSLMCGALLVLGGGVTLGFTGKITEYPFVRKPYMLALAILVIDGVLAVCYMPHNPFAWVIFALVMGQMLINGINVHKIKKTEGAV